MKYIPLIFLLLSASVSPVCPPGSIYDNYFNTCYKFVQTPKSFLDAEVFCNSLGGHLADESNAFESSYISGIASGASSQTPNFWIGANLLRSSNWSWTSNASMIYTNWAYGQPNSAYPCAFVKNTEATWTTQSCNSQLPFMCKLSPNAAQPETCPTQSSSPTSQSPPSTCFPDTCPYDSYCTDGYMLYARNCLCYKYFNDTFLTFLNANASCAKNGGMLAKIPSKDVNDFLTVLPGFETIPWIGLSCTSDSTSSCSWVDGTPLGNYTNFFAPAPYAYCLKTGVKNQSFVGMWESVGNGDRLFYLCQKESLKAGLPPR